MLELGWHGFSLLQVAAPEQFLGNDPIGSELVRLEQGAHQSGRFRIKARDAFYGDLSAAVLGIEKTNITDVFQLGHAARLYETLYPVASFQRRRREDLMQAPVDDFNKEVRQAIFDRLSVRYLVSNRFEADPGWPIACAERAENRPGSSNEIRPHCRVLMPFRPPLSLTSVHGLPCPTFGKWTRAKPYL